ncbi:unnamed protein product, partial [Iphiclides podalirius]
MFIIWPRPGFRQRDVGRARLASRLFDIACPSRDKLAAFRSALKITCIVANDEIGKILIWNFDVAPSEWRAARGFRPWNVLASVARPVAANGAADNDSANAGPLGNMLTHRLVSEEAAADRRPA